MRQAGREDINFIATMVGNGQPLLNGYYGNSLVINKEDLTDGMLLWADAIICGKNKTRDAINKRVRALKGFKGDLPQYGEKVVCRSNNWIEGVSASNGYVINLCNGLIGTVVSNPDVSSFDGKLFSMNFAPDLAPNAIFKNSRCNYAHMVSENDTRVKIRANKYEVGNKFEFAYCITAHIAQGSQFHKVVYIEEHMNPAMQPCINLVGASRADQQLVYVKSS
jgi:ATP-dependent exoDNAse (exonuclease V) alpha subunit